MTPLSLPKHHPAPRFAVTGPQGDTVAWVDDSFRSDLLLVLLHGPQCPYCVRIAEELIEHRDAWERWGTALLLLYSEPGPGFPSGFRQAYDSNGEVRRRYSGGAGADVV